MNRDRGSSYKFSSLSDQTFRGQSTTPSRSDLYRCVWVRGARWVGALMLVLIRSLTQNHTNFYSQFQRNCGLGVRNRRDIVSSAIEPVPEINLATDLAADCMVTRVAIC